MRTEGVTSKELSNVSLAPGLYKNWKGYINGTIFYSKLLVLISYWLQSIFCSFSSLNCMQVLMFLYCNLCWRVFLRFQFPYVFWKVNTGLIFFEIERFIVIQEPLFKGIIIFLYKQLPFFKSFILFNILEDVWSLIYINDFEFWSNVKELSFCH